MILGINTNDDPWGTLILLGILVGICAFPFVVGGLADLLVRATNAVFANDEAEFDHVNTGIAVGFGAAAIEFFFLVAFVIPRYS